MYRDWKGDGRIGCSPPAPKLKDPDNFTSRTHQFSLHFPICSSPQEVIPGLTQEEESELSKSTVFTRKLLDNLPTQINIDRRDKQMALVSLAPTNYSNEN